MDATPETAAPQTDEKRDIEENKDIAAFSYLWIMSIFVYFLRKNSPFVRYHSKQAIVLFLISVVVWFIPYLNRPLELIVLACMAYGFLSAAQGQKKSVPIIGPLSRGEITLREAWQQLVALAVRVFGVFKDMTKAEDKKKPEDAKTPQTPEPPKPEPQSTATEVPLTPPVTIVSPTPTAVPETRNSQPETPVDLPPSPPQS